MCIGSGKWFTMAGLATAESPVCQEQRPTRGPSMVTNKPPGGRMSTLNSFHLEEAVLCASETLVTHTLLPFLGSSKEGSEAASSKMKEIIRPGWTGNRDFWQVGLMFTLPQSSPDAPSFNGSESAHCVPSPEKKTT